MLRFIISALLVALISGCQITSDPEQPIIEAKQSANVEYMYSHFHSEVEQLNFNLLEDMKSFRLGSTIAVMTFVTTDSLDATPVNAQEYMIGQQLSESIATILTQMGFKVVEHRITQAMKLKTNQSLMLSYDPKQLVTNQQVDYVLTGTYTLAEKHLIVNSKLVDLSTNIAVAAANRAMPMTVLWSDTKVKQRAGMLYRSNY